MYRFSRSAQVQGTKFNDAVAFAHEVADYINTTYGFSIRVYLEMFGEVNKIYWQTDFKELPAWENYITQVSQDQKYWEIVDKARDLFIEGSLHDTLLREI